MSSLNTSNMTENFEESKVHVKKIVADGVANCTSLDDVKRSIKFSGLSISQREEIFIQNTYIKESLDLFTTETKEYFEEISRRISKETLLFHVNTLEKILSPIDIKQPFDKLKSYKLFQNCQVYVNTEQKQLLHKRFLEVCWTCVSSMCENLQFFDELWKCIRQCFMVDGDFLGLLFRDVIYQYDVGQFFYRLINTTGLPFFFDKLKEIASHSGDTFLQSAGFCDIFKQVVQEINKPYSIEIIEGEEIKILCYRNCIDLKQAVSCIHDKVRVRGIDMRDVKEVKIFAFEVLRANCDIQWPGTNLIIASEDIHITSTSRLKWDVSGQDSKEECKSKARSGQSAGENGDAGEDGCHGQNGGNVLILTNFLKNADNITIVSNGGNGSSGQDGGDGKDGEDGEDGIGLKDYEFKERFPDTAVFIGQRVERNIDKCFKNEIKRLDDVSNDSNDFYCKFQTKENNLVKIAHHENDLFVFRQAYCIHYGTEGTFGKRGGDGGSGGKVGLGGYGGTIDIIGLQSKTSIENKATVICDDGCDGLDGKDGLGGRGGINGKNGRDNARVTEYKEAQTKWFGPGHLRLRYTDFCDSRTRYAWCPKSKKYVSIVEVLPPSSPKRAKSGQKGKITKSNHCHRRRPAPLLAKCMQEEFSTDAHSNSTFKSRDTFSINLTEIKSVVVQSGASNVNFEERKVYVERLVSNGVASYMTLDDVRMSIKLCGWTVSRREEAYIQNVYIEESLDCFINETKQYLGEKILSTIPKETILQHVNIIQQIRLIQDIKKPFDQLKSYELLKECQRYLHEQREHIFCQQFLEVCWTCLSSKCESLLREKEFLDEFLKCVRECFIFEEDFLRVLFSGGYQDVRYIFKDTQNLPPFFNKLKVLASELGDSSLRSNVFLEKIKKIVQEINDPYSNSTQVIEGDKLKILCRRHFVDLKQAVSCIHDVVSTRRKDMRDVKEVKIFAYEVLRANCDICWPGTNLIITSKEIHIISKDNLKWDFSGQDAKADNISKARDGQTAGEDGDNGQHGYHGESGGNVLILTDAVINADKMTIISNGGNGSCGQGGGDGKDGMDGEDGICLNSYEFKDKFPDSGVFSGSTSGQNRNRCLGNAKVFLDRNDSPDSIFIRSYYYKFHTYKDNLVEMAHYETFFSRQTYCIHYGNEGTYGRRGGDGGSGGKAGLGGYGGTFDFIGLHNTIDLGDKVTVISNFGSSASDGNDGSGGRGGKNGKKGRDNARVTESGMGKTYWYGPGHFRLSYSHNKCSDKRYAFCIKNNKNVSISEVSPPSLPERAECGQKGKSKKTNHQSKQSQRRRKATIIANCVADEFYAAAKDNSIFKSLEITSSDLRDINLLQIQSQMSTSNGLHTITQKKECVKRDVNNESESPNRLIHVPEFCKKGSVTFLDQTIVEGTRESKVKPSNEVLQSVVGKCLHSTDCISTWLDCFKEIKTEIHGKCLKTRNDVHCVKDLLEASQESIRKQHLQKDQLDQLYNDIRDIGHYSTENMDTDPEHINHTDLWLEIQVHVKSTLHLLMLKQRWILMEEISEKITKKSSDVLTFSQSSEFSHFDSADVGNFIRQINLEKFVEILQSVIYDKDIDDKEKLDDFIDGSIIAIHNEFLEDVISEIQTEYFQFLPDSPAFFGDNACNNDDLQNNDLNSVDGKDTATSEWDNKETEISSQDLQSLSLPIKVIRYIQKLAFVRSDGVKLLQEVLLSRFFSEGVQISQEVLQLLVTRIVETSCDNNEFSSLDDFTRIFATKKQESWLTEYVLMQMQIAVNIPMEKEMSLRLKLSAIEDETWLLFLSNQLKLVDPDTSFSLNTIDDLALAIERGNLDDNTVSELRNLPISEWPFRLRLHREFAVIHALPVTISDSDVLIEAAGYFWGLRNRHGDSIIKHLTENLTEHDNVDEINFMALLRNLFSNRWPCEKKTFQIVKDYPDKEWEKQMAEIHFSQEERDLEKLIAIVREDSNSSLPIENLYMVKEILRSIEKQLEDTSEGSQSQQEENISKFTKEDVRSWVQRKKSVDIRENMVENLSVVFRGIFLETGLKLRLTQQLSILLFLLSANKGRGMLEQVSTGEGKSLIVVALAIVNYLSGGQVDIITSSSVLAKRDAEDYSGIYRLFGASVSHNCCENLDDRKKAYQSSIVYGEIGTFQRDILLDEFYDENILGDRKSDNVIIDEVDSMLLDKGQNVLYLSHSIPGMDTLEPLYIHIWNFVHAKDLYGSDEDIELVYKCAMDAMFGTMQIDDLRMSFSESTLKPSQIQYVWQYLIDEEVIDKAGRILKKTAIINGEYTVHCPDDQLSQTQSDVITCTLKDCIRRGSEFSIPHYLENFVIRHLKNLIKNAFKARFLHEGEHYIIDVDKSTMYQERSCNVIIMDTDTGTEQYNSQWNNGLHQFLQLKHGCRISFESLKAVFMSNITFFKRYEPDIYGLTGTLGSERERELLKDLYSIEYMTIPTFRPSKFIEENAIICGTKDEWMKNILRCVCKVSKSRPVLIICETIREVEQIEKEFIRNTSIVPHVYKHSHQEIDIFKTNSVPKQCVILATNLAGRGTDIKIDDKTDDSGGLFVCLTYLPSNIRVEQQAFGRSARKGQNGSGKLIILHTDCDSNHIHDAVKCSIKKTERNLLEQRRISKIKDHYERKIKVEEQLFMEFQSHFKALKNIEEKKETDRMKMSLIRQSLLDRWAIWLDSVEESINDGKDVKRTFTDFCGMIDVSSVNLKKAQSYRNLIKYPANSIKLAKILMEEGTFEEAETTLDEVIRSEPQFCEAAYYYKAHCMVKRTKLEKDEDKRKFKTCLHKAKLMITTRIDQMQNSVIKVNVLSDQYTKSQDSFLFADDYRVQKEGVISVFYSFLQSIDDACGHEVTLDMIEDISSDPFQATVIYQDLLDNGILEGSRVDCQHSERHHRLQEKYFLYSNEIINALDRVSNRATVRAKDFANILPSREEFWIMNRNVGILSDEIEYVLVNKRKLKEVHLNETVRKKILDSSEDVKDVKDADEQQDQDDNLIKEVWLYEHSCDMEDATQKKKDDQDGTEIILLRKSVFEAHVDNVKMQKLLKRKGIILINKRATLHPGIDPVSIHLEKYDEITPAAFAVIEGVKSNQCGDIFHHLTVQGFISSSMPARLLRQDFENINFYSYMRFKTEIINILQSNFQYRLAIKQFQTDGTINFPTRPHKNLFDDLIKFKIITPVTVKGNMNEGEVTKMLDTLYGENCSWKKAIASKIELWKSGLHKYDKIDSNLFDLPDSLNEETKVAMTEELITFSLNGLDHIISLCEVKWSWQCICRIAAIVAIGVIQIIAGALLEIVTAGVFTHVASGLIGEGIGDIMFAIECAVSGYCTFTSYLQNKAISLAFTVMTSGIGMWFSRGSKFSRYSYKIGGELLPNLTGKELVKQVGKRALAREVTKRVGKKVIEAAAYGAASAGMDHAIEHLVRKQLQTFCDSIVADVHKKTETQNLVSLAHKLRISLGPEKAMRIINEINEHVVGSCTQEWDEIYGVISRMASMVFSGFGVAAKKLQRSSDNRAKLLSNLSQLMSGSVKLVNIGNSTAQLIAVTNIILKDIEHNLEKQIKNHSTASSAVGGNVMRENEKKDFENRMVDAWKQMIAHKLQDKLTTDFVKPAAQHCTNSAVNYAGQCLKHSIAWFRNSVHNQEFIKLQKKYGKDVSQAEKEKDAGSQNNTSVLNDIRDEYNKELTKLLKKTRDPLLFATIVKEGVPLGVHSAQAVAECFGRSIEINVLGGEGLVMPTKFEPSSRNTKRDPILLDFHVGENGVGHFSSPAILSNEDMRESKSQSLRFDCLLEAVHQQTGKNIDRDIIAHHIETDPVIRSRIERGIHAHFIQKGGVGGKKPTEKQMQNMKRGKNKRGLYSGCSLHEIFQRQYKDGWKNLSKSVKDSHLVIDGKIVDSYNYGDLYSFARIDHRYVVFLDDNGNIRGHSGTFETNKDTTKGQAQYHEKIHNEICPPNKTKSPQDAFVDAIIKNDELTGEAGDRLSSRNFDGGKNNNLKIRLTGQNLADKKQREQYCFDFNLERFKNLCIAEKLETCSNQKNQVKIKTIDKRKWEIVKWIGEKGNAVLKSIEKTIKSAKSFKELGKIMMRVIGIMRNLRK